MGRISLSTPSDKSDGFSFNKTLRVSSFEGVHFNGCRRSQLHSTSSLYYSNQSFDTICSQTEFGNEISLFQHHPINRTAFVLTISFGFRVFKASNLTDAVRVNSTQPAASIIRSKASTQYVPKHLSAVFLAESLGTR